MWNSAKSLNLSWVCTRILIVCVVVFAICLPWLLGFYVEVSPFYSRMWQAAPLMLVLYLCCLPALAALFCLERLLTNIKKGEIFVPVNVQYLRRISWCCFAAAAFLACGVYYYLAFIAVAIAAAFIGLILRVVKNVIQQAVEIKMENDYTI